MRFDLVPANEFAAGGPAAECPPARTLNLKRPPVIRIVKITQSGVRAGGHSAAGPPAANSFAGLINWLVPILATAILSGCRPSSPPPVAAPVVQVWGEQGKNPGE